MKMFLRLFLLAFVLFPMIFMGVGIHVARNQDRIIRTYRPVQVTVLSKKIESKTSTDSDGHTSTSYKPVIHYRYEVDGAAYTCQQVTPLDESSGQEWARALNDRFEIGKNYEAYYNPRNPAEAFLVRECTFFPYVFILFPMLFWMAAFLVYMQSQGVLAGARPPSPAEDGWYLVRPISRIADRRRAAMLLFGLWMTVGILALGHYFRLAQPPYGMFATIVSLIYAGIGLVPLALFIYWHLLVRQLGDAEVFVNGPTFALGDRLAVFVEQAVFKPLEIRQLEVTLLCEAATRQRSGNSTHYNTHAHYRQRIALLENPGVRAEEKLTVNGELVIPPDQPASSSPKDKSYPRYSWRIKVETRIDHRPDYRSVFPILVQPASESSENM